MVRNAVKALVFAGVAAEMMSTARGEELAIEDYIAIQQLNARYVYAVDTCTNSGYDYADLYAKDGTFGVSTAWGVEGKIWARGREALARAGGGGADGCRERDKTSPVYGIHHVVTSLVIVATPSGAAGTSTLLAIGVGGEPTTIEWQGGYEDTYVKTTQGWRIQSRWHVWLDQERSIQYRSMMRSAAASAPAAPSEK